MTRLRTLWRILVIQLPSRETPWWLARRWLRLGPTGRDWPTCTTRLRATCSRRLAQQFPHTAMHLAGRWECPEAPWLSGPATATWEPRRPARLMSTTLLLEHRLCPW